LILRGESTKIYPNLKSIRKGIANKRRPSLKQES
jgi:hypothetical protein